MIYAHRINSLSKSWNKMLYYCHFKIKVEKPRFIEVLVENNISFVCTVLNTFTQKPSSTLFISQTSENSIHLQIFFSVLNNGYTERSCFLVLYIHLHSLILFPNASIQEWLLLVYNYTVKISAKKNIYVRQFGNCNSLPFNLDLCSHFLQDRFLTIEIFR